MGIEMEHCAKKGLNDAADLCCSLLFYWKCFAETTTLERENTNQKK